MKVLDTSALEQLVDAKKPVIVDFWAPWCGPCKVMAKPFEKLEGEFSHQITFAKVNVDEYPELAERFEVKGIPAFVGFDKGQLVDIVIGVDQPGLAGLVKKLAAG